MARAALGWSVRELASAAKVGTATITRFEGTQATPIPATLGAIQRAFEEAGIEFLDGDGTRVRRAAAVAAPA